MNIRSNIENENLKKLETWDMPYCTTKQTAELLGVTIRTVQLWVESGLLEAWRTKGGHRRILVSSLRNFLLGKERLEKARRLKVMVVEDDELMQEMYKLRLLNAGLPIDLRFAGNGFEALIKLGQDLPDVIITDLVMPEMDGFSLLRRLAKMPMTSSIKIFVVTSLDALEITAHGGLPAYIEIYQKPIPFSSIEAELKKIRALKLSQINLS